ncbi:hypothetical protein ACROYT_G014470 [Oculina patagonica]
MNRQVKFNPEVKRAVFSTLKSTHRCLEHLANTRIVEEDEIASRSSEFQEENRAQKRALHEYHLSRKRCRLFLRQDIFDAFWSVYEHEAWSRLEELVGTPDVTVNDVEMFGLEAVLSVNKNEIVKLWRERLMLMIPSVLQHELVPFHERWVQDQFKDQANIEEMQRRLCAKANTSNHWLTELVNEMLVSPDTPSTPEINYENLSGALNELEVAHPEIFQDLHSSVESTKVNNPDECLDTPPTPELRYDRMSQALNEVNYINDDICEDTPLIVESALNVHELDALQNESEMYEAEETESDDTLIEAMQDWEEKEIESNENDVCLKSSEQIGSGRDLWKSDKHYTLREIGTRKVRKFNTMSTDYHFSLKLQTGGTPLLSQLGNIFDSLVEEMSTGMGENDLVRFVLQSRSLDYPISLPFMPRHELNAERIMGEVQRVLQSNEKVNLKDGMHVHLVHVGMPQGGIATRKRKHYGFNLSKFLDAKKCVIRIRNKDSLCLARALVTDIARQEASPDWNSIRQGRELQTILAKELH